MYMNHSDTLNKAYVAQVKLVNYTKIDIVMRSGQDKNREKLYDEKVQKLSQDTIIGE